MSEATDWRASAGEAMLGVFELTRGLPAEPWRVAIVRSLAIVSNGLTAKAEPSALVKAMEDAVREALALEAAGLVDAELLKRLEPVFNALLGHRERSGVDDLTRPPPAVEPVLTGSRSNPPLLVMVIDEADPAPAAAAPEEAAPEPVAPADDDEAISRPKPLRITEDPGRHDPNAPTPPIVRLAEEGGEPRPLGQFYDGVVDRSLRMIAMLSRHRSERRMTEWVAEERRILTAADAVAATGAGCVKRVLDWWGASLESPDPWKTWAPCFTLGVVDGAASIRAVREGLRALPDTATRHAELAAEALVGSSHPDLVTLLKDLRTDPRPVPRAVGVQMASKLGLLSPEETVAHLSDPSPTVVLAAIRAAANDLPRAPELEAPLTLWMHHDDRAVAFAAAHTMMLRGRVEPVVEIRRLGKLVPRIGPLGVIELLVLGGEASDLTVLQTVLAKTEVSSALLLAVARIGHPGTWAFFLHYLAEKDFADVASEALYTLFGDRVHWKDRLNTTAWRDAIAAGRFDPERRIRRGEPWSPAVVAAECTSTSALLSRYDVEKRLAELTVRTGVPASVDMGRWSTTATPALVAYLAEMNQVSRSWIPGSWSTIRPR